jgi:hypothetical protein
MLSQLIATGIIFENKVSKKIFDLRKLKEIFNLEHILCNY